jgi:hypothetical protein
MVVLMSITVFWNVKLCSVLDRVHSEDGGSIFLLNFGTYLSNYTDTHPTWQ